MALRDVILSDSPTNYWEFGESTGTTLTATTGGQTMTTAGTVALNESGPAGTKAIRSVTLGYASTAYIDIFANTSFTFEFWFKVPSSAGGDGTGEFPTIFRRDGNGRTALARFRSSDLAAGNGVSKFESYYNTRDRYSTATINDGKWHHYVLSKSGSVYTEYLDGSASWWVTETGTLSMGAVGTTNPLYFLADSNTTYGTAKDISISNVAIYDTVALSDTRVTAHFNAGNAGGYTAQKMTASGSMGNATGSVSKNGGYFVAAPDSGGRKPYASGRMPLASVQDDQFDVAVVADTFVDADGAYLGAGTSGAGAVNTSEFKRYVFTIGSLPTDQQINKAELLVWAKDGGGLHPAPRLDVAIAQMSVGVPNDATGTYPGDPTFGSYTMISSFDEDGWARIPLDLSQSTDLSKSFVMRGRNSTSDPNHSETVFFGFESIEGINKPKVRIYADIVPPTGATINAPVMTGTAEAENALVSFSVSVDAQIATATGLALNPSVSGEQKPDVTFAASIAIGSANLIAPAVLAGGGFTGLADVMTATGLMNNATVDFRTDVVINSASMDVVGKMVTPKYVNGFDISYLSDPFYVLTRNTTDIDDLWYRFAEQQGTDWVYDERPDPINPGSAYTANGRLFGSPVFTTGVAGHRALSFDGVDDYIQVGMSPTSDDQRDYKGSLMFHIKTDVKNQVIMTGQGRNAQQNVYLNSSQNATKISLENGRIKVEQGGKQSGTGAFIPNTAYPALIGSTDVADGQWHQVVLTSWWYADQIAGAQREGRTPAFEETIDYGNGTPRGLSIYIDGKLNKRQAQDLTQSQIMSVCMPDLIGRVDGQFFKGEIAELVHRFAYEYPKYYIEQSKYAFFQDEPIRVSPIQANAVSGEAKAKGNTKKILALYFRFAPSLGGVGTTGGTGNVARKGDDSLWASDNGGLVAASRRPYFGGLEAPLQGVSTGIDDSLALADGVKLHYQSAWFSGNDSVGGRLNYFRDEVTGEPRYIDLQKDIDLSGFDGMIFVNFPGWQNDQAEIPHRDKAQRFDDFIESVKKAVFDDGLNFYCQIPSVAKALGLVEDYDLKSQIIDGRLIPSQGIVPAPGMRRDYRAAYNNPFLNDEALADRETPLRHEIATIETYDRGEMSDMRYYDSHRNNRHRIVGLVPGFTDLHGVTLAEEVWYFRDSTWATNSEEFAQRYNTHPQGLKPGDEFLITGPISGMRESTLVSPGTENYVLVSYKPEEIRVGTPIACESEYLDIDRSRIPNPTANNVTAFVVQPGEVLDGRTINGKIAVLGNDTVAFDTHVDFQKLDSTTWKNAFAHKENETSRKWQVATWRFNTYTLTIVLSSDKVVGFNGAYAVKTSTNQFQFTMQDFVETEKVRFMSMQERALTWLVDPDPVAGEGDVIVAPNAATASALIKTPGIGAVRNNVATAGVASGAARLISPVGLENTEVNIIVFPAQANARMVQPAKVIFAGVATATAKMIDPPGYDFDLEDTIYLKVNLPGAITLTRNGDGDRDD